MHSFDAAEGETTAATSASLSPDAPSAAAGSSVRRVFDRVVGEGGFASSCPASGPSEALSPGSSICKTTETTAHSAPAAPFGVFDSPEASLQTTLSSHGQETEPVGKASCAKKRKVSAPSLLRNIQSLPPCALQKVWLSASSARRLCKRWTCSPPPSSRPSSSSRLPRVRCTKTVRRSLFDNPPSGKRSCVWAVGESSSASRCGSRSSPPRQVDVSLAALRVNHHHGLGAACARREDVLSFSVR